MTDPWRQLYDIVVPALAANLPAVDVPEDLLRHFDYTDHPKRWPWIPGIDGHPPVCGSFTTLPDTSSESWCLLDEDHGGPHGWELDDGPGPVLAIQKFATNGHLIAATARLGYLRKEWRTLDATHGYGTFWKVWQPDELVRTDLDPAKSPDVPDGVDFTKMPWGDRTFQVVVFDPPYKMNGRPDDDGVDERFGVHEATSWRARMALIRAGARECARVANTFLLVKCQDQVVGSVIRWQTRAIEDEVAPLGFGLRDRFEYLSRRPQPAGRGQINAHRCSSQLLVFQRGWEWSDIDPPADDSQLHLGFDSE